MAIVEAKVKPDRLALPPKNNWNRDVAKRWWQFGANRPELHAAIAGLDRVLVISRVGQQAALTFLPGRMVFSEQLIVFPFDTHAAFCALQARPHEIWARFFGSSMKDDLRYTPSDCFETFPFPEGWETHPALGAAGRAYYDFRAALMVKNNEGLTKTYNRFHDPSETSPDILRLRELHATLDRAVLDAYGWTDIRPTCEFLLDYEDEEDEEEQNGGRSRQRKKPWRYRWPDDVRDEVLARLLDLNARRAADERRSGAATAAAEQKARKSEMRQSRKKTTRGHRSLPTMESE